MRFLSKGSNSVRFGALGLLLVLVLPGPVGAVATARTVIIQEGRVIEEDLFAAGSRVIVEGTIRGDLTVSATSLLITGVVEGSVNGLVWRARIDGEVQGSVRLVGWDVQVQDEGVVERDVLALARRVGVDGRVGRDLLAAGLSGRNSGEVGREIRGEFLWGLEVDGLVGTDVDVGVHRLEVTDRAVIGQALIYRDGLIAQNVRGWGATADISPQADVPIVAKVEPLPTDIATRALLVLFQILRFLAVLLTGVVIIGVFPTTSQRATDEFWRRPGRSLLVGIAGFLLVPLVAVVTVFTVVLAPLALVVLAFWLFGLIAGAVPPLAALGRRVLRRRYGLVGSFISAAIVWRLLRIIPLVGILLFFLVVIWGMGAWLVGIWESSRFSRSSRLYMPPARRSSEVAARMELLGLDVPSNDAGAGESGGDGSP